MGCPSKHQVHALARSLFHNEGLHFRVILQLHSSSAWGGPRRPLQSKSERRSRLRYGAS